ncbi:MAG: lysylphosphatidylglycerol synthase transmembrane domain-containing protein [bacterium]|jgi:uncharacterized membrane protein YbhN (UPF0104 family)
MRYKRIHKILLLIITLIVFLLLFSQVNFIEIQQTLRRTNYYYLALAGLLSFLFPLLNAIRWHLIVCELGVNLGLWESFKIIMAAWPLGTITPAKSGDLVKLFFLRNVLPYSHTSGVILAERLLDVLVLCLYAFLFGILVKLWVAVWISLAMFSGVVILFLVVESRWMVYLPEKILLLTQNIFLASKKIYSSLSVFLLLLLVTLLNWFLSLLQTWVCYQAFDAQVPFVYLAAALPLAIFIGLIPVTISGMGTRDTAMIVLFEKYAAYETNLAAGILYSIFGYWLLTLLGLPFMKAAFDGAIEGVEGQKLRKKALAEE